LGARYRPRLSALGGPVWQCFPVSFSKTQALSISLPLGVVNQPRRDCWDPPAAEPKPWPHRWAEALGSCRKQRWALVDENGAPTGNADGRNPPMAAEVAVGSCCHPGGNGVPAGLRPLGCSGHGSCGGLFWREIVVSDRFLRLTTILAMGNARLCWAPLSVISPLSPERTGASGEIGADSKPAQQLFGQWHRLEGRRDRLGAQLPKELPANPTGI